MWHVRVTSTKYCGRVLLNYAYIQNNFLAFSSWSSLRSSLVSSIEIASPRAPAQLYGTVVHVYSVEGIRMGSFFDTSSPQTLPTSVL